MRNILSTLFAFGLATIASAQFEIRPHVGTNFQNLTKSEDGTEWKGNPGFQVGVNLMIGNQHNCSDRACIERRQPDA